MPPRSPPTPVHPRHPGRLRCRRRRASAPGSTTRGFRSRRAHVTSTRGQGRQALPRRAHRYARDEDDRRVPCVVVQDRLYLRGTSASARPTGTPGQKGNVWYFGEDTAELDNHGHVTSTGAPGRPASTAPNPASTCRPTRASASPADRSTTRATPRTTTGDRPLRQHPPLGRDERLLTQEMTPLEPECSTTSVRPRHRHRARTDREGGKRAQRTRLGHQGRVDNPTARLGPVAQAVEPSALDGGDEDRNLPGPPPFHCRNVRRAADAHLAHEGRGDASKRKSRGLTRGHSETAQRPRDVTTARERRSRYRIGHGAFMEQSGRNRRQPSAKVGAAKSARTTCEPLQRVATVCYRANMVGGSTVRVR